MYEKLDAAILNNIAGGRSRFIDLLGIPEVREQSAISGRHRDNVLNGRLQALRKRGKIHFDNGWWLVPEVAR